MSTSMEKKGVVKKQVEIKDAWYHGKFQIYFMHMYGWHY